MVNEVREVQDLGVIIQVESCRETGIFEGKLKLKSTATSTAVSPATPIPKQLICT